MAKMRLRQISVSLHRPNEYTRWRPRIERGAPTWSWTAFVWGPLVLTVDREQKPDGRIRLLRGRVNLVVDDEDEREESMRAEHQPEEVE